MSPQRGYFSRSEAPKDYLRLQRVRDCVCVCVRACVSPISLYFYPIKGETEKRGRKRGVGDQSSSEAAMINIYLQRKNPIKQRKSQRELKEKFNENTERCFWRRRCLRLFISSCYLKAIAKREKEKVWFTGVPVRHLEACEGKRVSRPPWWVTSAESWWDTELFPWLWSADRQSSFKLNIRGDKTEPSFSQRNGKNRVASALPWRVWTIKLMLILWGNSQLCQDHASLVTGKSRPQVERGPPVNFLEMDKLFLYYVFRILISWELRVVNRKQNLCRRKRWWCIWKWKPCRPN